MLQITVDLGKVTDWLALLVNSFVFVSGLVILIYARRNVDAVLKQLRSQSQHQIIEAHKTLYMPIVQDEALSSLLFPRNTEAARRGILASMIINHASRIFADHENGISAVGRLPGFRDDLGGLFNTPSISERWAVVKRYHRAEFVEFVDSSVAAWSQQSTNDPVYGYDVERADLHPPLQSGIAERYRWRWPWRTYGSQ